MPDMSSVVYDDWRGEEWLPRGGRRCRHLPTGCVFDVRPVALGEYAAELREGSATPELIELAKGYFRVFGCINPAHQPPGVPWASSSSRARGTRHF
jgi:hypothetical protein